MINRRQSSGFTVLEVLLAFVIFAISFATVLEILGGSMRSTTRARTSTEAALLAQSLVDMVGIEIPLTEGTLAGTAPGGYDWQLSISAYQSQTADDRTVEIAELAGTVLFWIDLDLQWGTEQRTHQAHFSTVRSQLASFQVN